MIRVGNAPEGIVVAASGVAAVAVRHPNGIVFFDAATAVARGNTATTGAACHLSLAAPDGPVLAPLESSDQLLALTFPDRAIASVVKDVGRQPHDAVMTRHGTVVVLTKPVAA